MFFNKQHSLILKGVTLNISCVLIRNSAQFYSFSEDVRYYLLINHLTKIIRIEKQLKIEKELQKLKKKRENKKK